MWKGFHSYWSQITAKRTNTDRPPDSRLQTPLDPTRSRLHYLLPEWPQSEFNSNSFRIAQTALSSSEACRTLAIFTSNRYIRQELFDKRFYLDILFIKSLRNF
jgi:hypothetical protein